MSAVERHLGNATKLAWSFALAPLLAYSIKYNTRLHGTIARPLLSGPFEGTLVKKIDEAIYDLELGELNDYSFILAVSSAMRDAIQAGELDYWLEMDVRPEADVDVVLKRCFGFAPLKWWYLKLHFMAVGNVHHLHAHRNVISAQVVARGKLRVREFDLVGPLENPARLRVVRNGDVGPLGALISTDSFCNVHGFEPAGEPAVRFQFYLRGHCSFRDRLFPKRGRLYLHPRWDTLKDDIVLADLGEAGRSGES